MELVLIRHAERDPTRSEDEASLTANGLAKARATAQALKARKLRFDIVLRSISKPAEETADLLHRCKPPLALNSLTPPKREQEMTWETIWNEVRQVSCERPEEQHCIALVAHHPGVTRLLRGLTGRKSRTIARGEAIWLSGSCKDMQEGKAKVKDAIGSENDTALQKKLESKVLVSSFLAAFAVPALVELVKEPKDHLEIPLLIAIVLFTLAFSLFAAAVYIFDNLSMPKEFWRDRTEKGEVRSRGAGRLAHKYRAWFEHTYLLNGPLYAYMVRTWYFVFTPALWSMAAAFLALIFEWKNPVLLFACLAVIAAAVAVWAIFRPDLGIED